MEYQYILNTILIFFYQYSLENYFNWRISAQFFRGLDKITSRVGCGPRAVVWRPLF
jgi:hypothetical protein